MVKEKNLVKFFQYYLKLFFNQGQRQLEKKKQKQTEGICESGINSTAAKS